jgi:hypothetical protein
MQNGRASSLNPSQRKLYLGDKIDDFPEWQQPADREAAMERGISLLITLSANGQLDKCLTLNLRGMAASCRGARAIPRYDLDAKNCAT